jgi:hypothetical protein
MIRQAIKKIQEETKVSGHDIQVTDEQVMAFLVNKFGEIDVLSSYSVVGNMIKMLFVAQGHTSSYTTELKWVIKNVDFDDGV